MKKYKCDNQKCKDKNEYFIENMSGYDGKNFCSLECVNDYAEIKGKKESEKPIKAFYRRILARGIGFDYTNDYLKGT